MLKNFKVPFKFRNFKEEIDFFFNFRDIRSSFALLLSWFNWTGKMWIIGAGIGVTRGKTGSNAKISVSEDAFITKTGSRIISDSVNWIRVMQAFGREILCMLMNAMSQ